jgi:hypothetical protein
MNTNNYYETTAVKTLSIDDSVLSMSNSHGAGTEVHEGFDTLNSDH